MENYLEKDIACSCGKTHRVPIKEVIIEEEALLRVPELLQSLTAEKKIFLVSDGNTYEAAGRRLNEILSGSQYSVQNILLEEEHVKVTPESIFSIMCRLEHSGYIVACGSGSINDLCKFVSSKMGKQYTVVATAPSMDGYASSGSSITVNRVKQTYVTSAPEAIVADLNILKKAPWSMVQAGFGDLLGKLTSLLDWKISRILLDEYYCPEIYGLINKSLEDIIKIGVKLKNRDTESIRVLINGLIDSGLAMLMANSSRPASGTEHFISHFLDMKGLENDKAVPLHGIKVGLGTYFAASFYLKLREEDFYRLKIKNDKEERVRLINKYFANSSSTVRKTLDIRWEQEVISSEKVRAKELKIKTEIDKSADYLQRIKEILLEIGILERDDILSLQEEWLAGALLTGFEIRPRYTIATFLRQSGLLNQYSSELLSDWTAKKKK